MAVIRVIEVGDVPRKYLDVMIQELNKRGFNHKFIIDSKMPLPAAAYDKYRGQYDAQKLLTVARDPKVLFVTNADIYSQNRNFVFGLNKDHGPCIVSLARLDTTFYGNPLNFGVTAERLVKESVHEVGHMFGLTHGEDKRCVMSCSSHFSDVDGKNRDMCRSCEVRLSADGIRI
jgi:archaemetzincin